MQRLLAFFVLSEILCFADSIGRLFGKSSANKSNMAEEAVDVLHILSSQLPEFRLQVLYDSDHEDVAGRAKEFSKTVPNGLELFQYNGSTQILEEILASASLGKTVLFPLCGWQKILTMFRKIRSHRLQSHFALWLLVASDEETLENIILGLEGIVHEGTKVSLFYKLSQETFSVFSTSVDEDGVVRFSANEDFVPPGKIFPDEDESHIYKDMRGREMLVAANDFEGFFGIDPRSSESLDGRQELLGIDGSIVETLSDALNFTYRIVRPADGYWGNPLPDGTVTGVIGMAARREVAFALCAIAVTELRETAVDFSYPYSMETLALFSRAPKERNRALAVLSPFTLKTWLCIIAAAVLIGPLLRLQAKVSEVLLKEKNKWSLQNYSFNAFRSFLVQGNRLKTKHWPLRCIFISWYLFGLIVSNVYSGMLIALLAIPTFETPIDSLSDIPRAIADGFTLGILKDTANEMIFREATEGLFKETWELFDHENPAESFILRPETGISRARDSKYIFIDLQISNEILIAKMGRRKFHVGRQAFHSHGIGIACPPGVPYWDTFSRLLRRMMEGGLLSKWRKDELTKVANLASENDEGSRDYAINLVHLQAAFFVIFLGCVAASLVLLIENVVWYTKCYE